jgi:predicted Zn-dependent peptidase
MIEKYTFDNGFRVIYEKTTNKLPISSIHCYVDLGSINETNNNRGSSHLIEHMLFKGTKHFKNSKDIFLKYDSIGAYFNAYTEKQLTCYTIKTQDFYINNCIYVLSDMLLNSTINKNEFEKEKNVVIEENIQGEDDIEDLINNMSDKLLYKNTVLEYPVDNISYHYKGSLQHDEILKIYKQYYIPSNFVLSIVSNVSFKKILLFLKNTFFVKKNNKITTIKNNENFIIPTTIKGHNIENIRIPYFQKKDGLNTTHIIIAFKTCSQYNINDKYILKILKNILAGPFSSRLFMLLREKNGLTYTSSVNTNFYKCGGDFEIYIEVDKSKIIKNDKKDGVFPIIIKLLNELIKDGITNEELIIIKQYLKGKLIIKTEDNDVLCSHNGENYLFNIEECSYSNIYDKYYKNISKKMVDDIIKKYFTKENMVVSIISGELPPINIIKNVCNLLV